jgi:hypothetical protein
MKSLNLFYNNLKQCPFCNELRYDDNNNPKKVTFILKSHLNSDSSDLTTDLTLYFVFYIAIQIYTIS